MATHFIVRQAQWIYIFKRNFYLFMYDTMQRATHNLRILAFKVVHLLISLAFVIVFLRFTLLFQIFHQHIFNGTCCAVLCVLAGHHTVATLHYLIVNLPALYKFAHRPLSSSPILKIHFTKAFYHILQHGVGIMCAFQLF